MFDDDQILEDLPVCDCGKILDVNGKCWGSHVPLV